MIEHVTGDIFESGCEALVNPVNCVGVMGKGLAAKFKYHYPSMFQEYKKACKIGFVRPGRMFVYQTGFLFEDPKFIINFPTKVHFHDKSLILHIESGLRALYTTILAYNIKTIAIPALGCGYGSLDWKEVRMRIVLALEPLTDVMIKLYEPR